MSINKNVHCHKINNRKNAARRSSRVTVSGPLISQMDEAQIVEAGDILDAGHDKATIRKGDLNAAGKSKSKAYRNCNRNLSKIMAPVSRTSMRENEAVEANCPLADSQTMRSESCGPGRLPWRKAM